MDYRCSTFGAFPGMGDVLSDRVRDATKAIALVIKAKWTAAEQSNLTIYLLPAPRCTRCPSC